jgi:hypothetical protein
MYQNNMVDRTKGASTLVAAAQSYSSAATARAPIAVIRHYLTHWEIEALCAQALTDELAMRATIIAEYMQEHAIQDVNQGIRAFTAFERERLQRLGLVAGPSSSMHRA